MGIHLSKYGLLLIGLILVPGSPAFSQEKKDTAAHFEPKITFSYLNTSDDSITLTANVYVKREEGFFSLENAPVEFFASAGQETKLLGKVKADADGNAILRYPLKSGIPVDKSGMALYSAKFPGNGIYEAASESLSAKLARIAVNFSKEDTAHYILISAKQVEYGGELTPLSGEKVILYVPRMLSLLKIGEVDLDDKGAGRVEYPEKLVGDSLGNITIVARIEESDKFGNVSGQSMISWGIPKQYYLAEKPTRELWTPIAPIWMIVTLIIMLTGVWAHYLYAVIQLIWIKLISRKD
jgi:hypothetical protein